MSENLKPCPFCGGEAGLFDDDLMVLCKGCGLQISRDDSDAAAAAWNRRADGWRPIETAPRDGTGIIYFQRVDEKLWWIGTATYADGHFRATDFFSKDDDPLIAPTHWMPLPEPPESEVKP